MPVTPKQRTAMGDERADACLRAQAAAREMAADRETGATPADLATANRADDASAAVTLPLAAEARAFGAWTPQRYKDSSLSAADWARAAALDANAGSRRSMNHVCLAKTCHKGRWAKLGFCRMFFLALGPAAQQEDRSGGHGPRTWPRAAAPVDRGGLAAGATDAPAGRPPQPRTQPRLPLPHDARSLPRRAVQP